MEYDHIVRECIHAIDTSRQDKEFSQFKQYLNVLLPSLLAKQPQLATSQYALKCIRETLEELKQEQQDFSVLVMLTWVNQATRIASKLNLESEKAKLLVLSQQIRPTEAVVASPLGKRNQSRTNEKTKGQKGSEPLHQAAEKYIKDFFMLHEKKTLNDQELKKTLNQLKAIIYYFYQKNDKKNANKYIDKAIKLCGEPQWTSTKAVLSKLPELLFSENIDVSNNKWIQGLKAHYDTIKPNETLIKFVDATCDLLLIPKYAQPRVLSQAMNLFQEAITILQENKDIEAAYYALDQGISIAEQLNMSKIKNQLFVSMGDLISAQLDQVDDDQKPLLDRANALKTTLDNYFEPYATACKNNNKEDMIKYANKISKVEAKFHYLIAKPGLIEQLIQASADKTKFSKIYQLIDDLGQRLIDTQQYDKAWDLYQAVQSVVLASEYKDYHHQLLKTFVAIIKEKNQLNKPQVLVKGKWLKHREELAKTRSQLKSNVDVNTFRRSQQKYTEDVIQLRAQWFAENVKFLGTPPDDFFIAGVGSIVRKTLAKGSDFESILVTLNKESSRIDNPKSKRAEYFLRFLIASDFDMYLLGEKRAFRNDSKGNPLLPRLHGNIKSILDDSHPTAKEISKKDEIGYSLLKTKFVYGNKLLYRKFKKERAQRLDQPISAENRQHWRDQFKTSHLNFHTKLCQDNEPSHPKHPHKLEPIIDEKKDMQSLITLFLSDCRLFLGQDYSDSYKNLEALVAGEHMNAIFVRACSTGLTILHRVRDHLHTHFKEQNDSARLYDKDSPEYIDCTINKTSSEPINKHYTYVISSNGSELAYYRRPSVEKSKKIPVSNITGLKEAIHQKNWPTVQRLISAYHLRSYFRLSDSERWQLELVHLALRKPITHSIEELSTKGDSRSMYHPTLLMVDKALASGKPQDLSLAIRGLFYMLKLASAKPIDFFRTYLPLAPKAREEFNKQLEQEHIKKMFNLNKKQLDVIKNTLRICPESNGKRENDEDMFKSWEQKLDQLSVSQPSKDQQDIQMTWINHNGAKKDGYLHPAVLKNLRQQGYLNAKNEFIISAETRNKTDGTHVVIPIKVDINNQTIKMHLKLMPESPADEIKTTDLFRLLAGGGTPFGQVARLQVGDKFYVGLITETIDGLPLHKGIKQNSDKIDEGLDNREFSWSFLKSILTNLEDGKPDNNILVKMPNGKYRIVSVDNARAFFISLILQGKTIAPTVKDIIYCFDKMYEPMDPLVRDMFLSYDPYKFLSHWLGMSKTRKEHLKELFSAKEIESLFSGDNSASKRFMDRMRKHQSNGDETILLPTMPKKMISFVYTKMVKIQAYWREHPNATAMELLSIADPYLYRFYSQLHDKKKYPTTGVRFKDGFSPLYTKERDANLNTMALVSLTTKTGRAMNEKEVKEFQDVSIDEALKELKRTHEMQSQWQDIRKQLLSGNAKLGLEKLKSLDDVELIQKIINQLDFSQLRSREVDGENLEQKILQTLIDMKISFRVLKLKNSNINDKQFASLLEESVELQWLVLDGCPTLTNDIIPLIEQFCPIIEKLVIKNSNLSKIKTKGSKLSRYFQPQRHGDKESLSHLNFIDVSSSPNLTEIDLAAPIRCLYANDCPKLSSVKTTSEKVEVLKLNNCSSMTAEQLSQSMTHFPFLTTVELQGCPNVKNADLYMAHPYLLRVNLDSYTKSHLKVLLSTLNILKPYIKSKDDVKKLLLFFDQHADAVTLWQKERKTVLEKGSEFFVKQSLLSLDKLGSKDPKLIQWLHTQKTNNSIPIRCLAIFALFNLEESVANEEMQNALKDALEESNDAKVMAKAMSILYQRIDIKTANATLNKVLANADNKQERTSLLTAMKDFNCLSPEFIKQVKTLFISANNISLQSEALQVLWKNRSNHVFVGWLKSVSLSLQDHIEHIQTENPQVAAQLSQMIHKHRPNLLARKLTNESIVNQLKHSKWESKVAMLQQLSQRPYQAIAYKKKILTLLNDGLVAVREEAAKTLRNIGRHDVDIEQALVSILTNTREYAQVQQQVLETLAYNGIEHAETLTAIQPFLSKKEGKLRLAALKALVKIKHFDLDVVESCCRLVNDSLVDVKQMALKVLLNQLSLSTLAQHLLTQFCPNAQKSKIRLIEGLFSNEVKTTKPSTSKWQWPSATFHKTPQKTCRETNDSTQLTTQRHVVLTQ